MVNMSYSETSAAALCGTTVVYLMYIPMSVYLFGYIYKYTHVYVYIYIYISDHAYIYIYMNK